VRQLASSSITGWQWASEPVTHLFYHPSFDVSSDLSASQPVLPSPGSLTFGTGAFETPLLVSGAARTHTRMRSRTHTLMLFIICARPPSLSRRGPAFLHALPHFRDRRGPARHYWLAKRRARTHSGAHACTRSCSRQTVFCFKSQKQPWCLLSYNELLTDGSARVLSFFVQSFR
jgi:hypothetical protein